MSEMAYEIAIATTVGGRGKGPGLLAQGDDVMNVNTVLPPSSFATF